MSALPTPEARDRAARLVAELETAVATLGPEELLDLQPGVERISGAIVRRALAAALDAGRRPTLEPPKNFTLTEAAARLGKSKSWLYHNRKRLGMGFKVGGELRFREADVERFLRVQSRRGLASQ